MATKLTKNLVRESLVKFKDREIMVTLTDDQKITLKEKGLKTGDVSVGILELFKKLKGVSDEKPEGPVSVKGSQKKAESKTELEQILNDIRSQNAISTASPQVISQLDGIISNMLKETRK
jgi:hypothetical protein